MATLDLTQVRVASSMHWLEEFGSWLRSTPTKKGRGRARLTLDAYLGDARQFNQSGHELTAESLKAYFQGLERTSSPATYNRKLASIRMIIAWAQSEDLLDHDPAAWIPFMDAARKSPRDVDEEERAALEAAAQAGQETLLGLRASLIFFLMANAGLRISETVNLKLSDLHLDEKWIHVYGKGGKHRQVKIGTRLAEVIRTWLDHKPASVEGTLITDESGLSITRQTAWRDFDAIRIAANVKTTPHAMRHTFIYRFMDACMAGDPWRLPQAIDAVCQQTGDKPEVILAYYTRARESDIRAAAEVL